MRKQVIDNPRYPHHIRIVRKVVGDWFETPSDGSASDEQETVEEEVYNGIGRCYTSGGVGEQAVDITARTISIPVSVREWGLLYPLSGDTVTVTMGAVTQTMEVKEFEPDNNRTVIYCKRNGNFDL